MKKRTPDWTGFIMDERNEPAVLMALNDSGGIYKGMAFESWSFDGNFFAIWNMKGNPVWCHKKNFKVLSRGTLSGLPKHIKRASDWARMKLEHNCNLTENRSKLEEFE